MRIVYDAETDTLTVVFRDVEVSESDELNGGIILDYDREGGIVGFELLDASHYLAEPQQIVYELKGKLTPAQRS